MKFFNLQKNNTQKGFTIIETLVAISILLISTTGPLSFSQSGLKASFLARDQIVAFYLAQDVIETIKNMRDNTALSNTSGSVDWLEGLGACQPPSGGTVKCTMDTGQVTINTTEICTNTLCPKLQYASSTREFVINSTSDTSPSKFTRTIYVTELVQDVEAQIVVRVDWESNFVADRRVIVQENMYNWVPAYTP